MSDPQKQIDTPDQDQKAEGIWKLRVVTPYSVIELLGYYDLMHIFYKEIKDVMQASAVLPDRPKAIEVTGFTDTSDRAETTTTIMIDAISTVNLTRYY